METPVHQSNEPTDTQEGSESSPDPGAGGVPTPATLPSDRESEGEAREGDEEHDTESGGEQEESVEDD